MKNRKPFLAIVIACLLSLLFACVPPGTGENAAADQTRATALARVIHLSSTEVTYSLWYNVYTWAVGHGYSFANQGTEARTNRVGLPPTAGKKYPVCNINWRDAIVWCNAYSEKSFLTPCYMNAAGVLRDSRDSNGPACDVTGCNMTAIGYRLPTVSEWVDVAGNHGRTPLNYASGAKAPVTNQTATKLVAWYNLNSAEASEVGKKTPNEHGLYDMSGNEWEWCWDIDPNGAHYLKGGCWYDDYPWLAIGGSESEYANQPDYEYSGYGFRTGLVY